MGKVLRSAAAGALGGAVATLAMSAVLLVGRRAGLFDDHPPELVIKRATAPTGPLPTLYPDEQEVAWPFGHLQFGAAMGLVYGVIRPALPRRLRTALGGGLIGVGLWLLNYGALAPALGLLPPVPREDTGRQVTNALAHDVYGPAHSTVTEWADRRTDGRSDR